MSRTYYSTTEQITSKINATSLVSEVPGKDPVISGIKSRYRVGDIVRGNCTSRHSKPAANLTWTINGREVGVCAINFKFKKCTQSLQNNTEKIHDII